MPRYQLYVRAPASWQPLERLARLCAERAERLPLRVAEFMYMGRLVSDGRPVIHLYKHIDTRRYLYLDDGGHAFSVQWRGYNGDIAATCTPSRSVVDAIAGVRMAAVDAGERAAHGGAVPARV